MFARYLLDRDPAPELIERYVEACARLFTDSPSARDAALMDFAYRHSGALPYLDAAAGFLRPGSLLRRKLLLMAAILEASPHYAGEFLEAPPGRARTLLLLIWYGLSAGLKFAIGALVLVAIPVRRGRPA
ncbi:MAG: hypothetical protein M3461_02690 [Pseudomonadota bacterium]|nr:hypothetical protein [Pseudomonadota bacterium]